MLACLLRVASLTWCDRFGMAAGATLLGGEGGALTILASEGRVDGVEELYEVH
jgi:hypothetical protein